MLKSFFRKNKYLILSFLIPIVVMGSSFILHEFYPFGDEQILIVDLWHQYFPFLNELHEKLQNGGSLLYSWNIGMGTNFLGLVSYYAASPLNLLTIFVPEQYMVVALQVLVLIKMGFAGMFAALFLKKVFHRNDVSLVIFSCAYGISGFMLGYYWNVMWLDTVALLPLLALGIHKVVKEGKGGLYTITLALSLFANYYIGFFSCIFALLYFFGVCIFCKTDKKMFFMGLLRMALYSVLGIGMSMILLLPAYLCLQNTYYAESSFPTQINFFYNLEELVKNIFAFQEPSYLEGAPNIYCGILPVLFIGIFFSAKNIRLKEKIYVGAFLVFLLLSFNTNVLDFIWHGFHYTNMVPHRFAFIFTFMVMVAGYRGYLEWRGTDFFDTLSMIFTTALLMVLGYMQMELKLLIANAILFGIFVVILVLYKHRVLRKKWFYITVSIVMAVEYVSAAYISVETAGSSGYSYYPGDNEAVTELVENVEELEKENTDFYRLEFSNTYTLNDSALYGTHGVTCFSSMCNGKVSYALEELGLAADDGSNRYAYMLTSPIMTSFLNIKYLITREGRFEADNWTDMSTSSHLVSYRNDYYLPLGFMTEKEILDTSFEAINPFDTQNEMFQLATGVKENVFEPVELTDNSASGCAVTVYDDESYFMESDNNGDSGSAELMFQLEEGKDVYGYATSNLGKQISMNSITGNGSSFQKTVNVEYPYMFFLKKGSGDKLTAEYTVENEKYGDTALYLRTFNEAVFSKGYETLADEPLIITDYTDTSVSGMVTAKSDGYLYTSIPYEKGWTLYVDGKETEIEPFMDAFVGVLLEEGEHTIELKYIPDGFVPGVCITIGSIGLFTAICIYKKRKEKRNHIATV